VRIVSTIVGFALIILGISGCTSVSQTSTNNPVRLTPAMFSDYELTLISDDVYAHYLFYDEVVNEESGDKNGPFIALFHWWKIKDGNRLVFTSLPDGTRLDNPENASYQFKSFGEKIVVTMDGQKFRRSKFKRPNGDPIEMPPDTPPEPSK
jgi:hypothetical protein